MQVFHGDCLEVMKGLPDKSVDLFVCDLPYGCLTTPRASAKQWSDYTKRTGEPRTLIRDDKEKCAWDIKIDLAQFWDQVKRLCRDDHTPVLMFCSTKFGFDLYNSNPEWFRYDLVWDKECGISFLHANKMPMRSHEMIYVFAKKGARYYRKDVEGDFQKWLVGKNGVRSGNHADAGLPKAHISGGEGTRCALSVIPCKTARSNAKGPKKEHKHPTQKPDDLYEFLITRYSKEGDTVLDPTAGSFASVKTAVRLGRKGLGIEKDDEFFQRFSSGE